MPGKETKRKCKQQQLFLIFKNLLILNALAEVIKYNTSVTLNSRQLITWLNATALCAVRKCLFW